MSDSILTKVALATVTTSLAAGAFFILSPKQVARSYNMVLVLPLSKCKPVFDEDPSRSQWILHCTKQPDIRAFLKLFSGSTIGVLGDFNKGKSFFLRLLSGGKVQGWEGFQVNTPGICFTFTNSLPDTPASQGTDFLFVDAAGAGSPLDSKIFWHTQFETHT